MKQYTETESKWKKTAEKIERFIEKTRKLPGTITGFDDMFWNLPV